MTISKFVTQQEAVLLELQQCISRGNVVGIVTKHDKWKKYLTAVEDIIRISEEYIVLIKRLDLQGIFHDQNRIALSDIDSVRVFKALYHDRLPGTLRKIAYQIDRNDGMKIRKRERLINKYDLRMILIKNIDSGYRLRIHLADNCHLGCYVHAIGDDLESIVIAFDLNVETGLIKIPLSQIQKIEFETFFNYKGLYSKIFSLNRSQSASH